MDLTVKSSDVECRYQLIESVGTNQMHIAVRIKKINLIQLKNKDKSGWNDFVVLGQALKDKAD